jgi:acetylglutamate kinase
MSAGVNAEALDADGAALAAAGSLAAEALALHRDALALLDEGWRSQSGSTATDLLRQQCGEGAELVAALRDAAAECRALCDAAEYPVTAVDDQAFSRLGDRPAARFGTPDP